MELDTNSPNLVTDTPDTVAAPEVAASTPEAPKVEAPKLKEPDEYFRDAAEKKKAKASSQPVEVDLTNTTPTPTPEKAPANSAAVAAPEAATPATPTPTTATTPADSEPVDYKARYEESQRKIAEIEQARQVEEARKLTQQQQTDLARDKALLDKTSTALDRKINQCNSILEQLAQARKEGDYEEIEALNLQYAEAYDEAQVLEVNRDRFTAEYQAKENYFKTQYAKSREGENQKALEQILKPHGLDAKAVIEQVPEQYRNNLLAVMDTALKQVRTNEVAPLKAEITALKEQLKTAKAEANAEARARWDSTNPASVPHKAGNGGNGGGRKWSPTDSAETWFRPVKL